jgi:hypothetical protein
MDIIGGLVGMGTYFNNHEHKTKYLDYGKLIKRTPINGINIYDSNNYREYKNIVADLAYKRYQMSTDPKKTGIIPNFYNQYVAVLKRWYEQKKEIIKREQKRKEDILEEQKINVEERTFKYKQIFWKGIIPCLILMIFVWITM